MIHAPQGMVASVDHLATGAGVAVLRDGGSAADAAIATNAVLTVTAPHMCGLGGDLFALVHTSQGPPEALNGSGRSGSGARPGDGVPDRRGDIRAVTVPGCVDGWQALHERHGRLPMQRLLADAIELAEIGFPASLLLEATAGAVADVVSIDPDVRTARTGRRVRRPGTAAALRSIVTDGRSGFYRGAFGAGLGQLGGGLFTDDDLARSHADWVEPLGVDALGHRIWTVPPNSQGYLALAGAAVCDLVGLPDDATELVETLVDIAIAVGHDRPGVLHEHATGLLAPERLAAAAAAVGGPGRAPVRAGDTTYLCAADRHGTAVSLIQSNADGFGAHIVEPNTGTFLHNRGLGFSADPDHPAAYGPVRRPPHTLSPLAVSHLDGSLHSVLGTMGGDAQPQVLLQLLVHLLVHDRSPARALEAPRWILADPEGTSFSTWHGDQIVLVEDDAPTDWTDHLESIGRTVEAAPAIGGRFGHAQAIVRTEAGWTGAADPRALIGQAAGH